MRLFNYKYLSQEQMKRLDTYKYSSIDNSPFSVYVMHPFWEFIVKFVPMSIAPNLLTLAGFTCTLINVLLLTYYDYNFTASSDDIQSGSVEPVPSFVWVICAINVFLSHTLDGIDGKQARRTKTTGPVGELMDHGVDSWTAGFVPMFIYSLFGSSDYSFGPHTMFFIFWAVFITFHLAHLEKYVTGTLFLPWSYDVSQVSLLVCTLITYFYSYKIWKGTVYPGGWPYSHFFTLILYISVFLSLFRPIGSIYRSHYSKKSKSTTSFKEVVRPIIPLAMLFTSSLAWAFLSPNDVLGQDPRVYYYVVGTVFSNIVCRLIVSHMTSSKLELINDLTAVFSLVALSSILIPSMAPIELSTLRLLAIILTLSHVHYAVCIIRQMCDYFKINCFSVKRINNGPRQQLLKNLSLQLK